MVATRSAARSPVAATAATPPGRQPKQPQLPFPCLRFASQARTLHSSVLLVKRPRHRIMVLLHCRCPVEWLGRGRLRGIVPLLHHTLQQRSPHQSLCMAVLNLPALQVSLTRPKAPRASEPVHPKLQDGIAHRRARAALVSTHHILQHSLELQKVCMVMALNHQKHQAEPTPPPCLPKVSVSRRRLPTACGPFCRRSTCPASGRS
jgi:hypothetical protein